MRSSRKPPRRDDARQLVVIGERIHVIGLAQPLLAQIEQAEPLAEAARSG